jgi:ParB family chromosome partitioning protein
MARTKNFMQRDARPTSAGEADFALLLEAHLGAKQSIPQNIPVERIRANPFQARRTFDGIDELAEAIRAHGFTTRLRVRRDPADPGFFQLVFGERRLRAAQVAELREVPCEVAEHDDAEMIEIGLAENIQRRDLDPLEEARAFRAFVDERGYTQRSLGERIGKDKSYIEERLALLRTPDDVQAMIAQRPDTIRVAREIAKLPSPAERRPLIQGVLDGELGTRDVLAIVRRHTLGHDAPATKPAPRPAPGAPASLDRAIDRDMLALRAIFARWRQMLPGLDAAQRARVAAYLQQHLVELDHLADEL